jgi:hypothetical protein
MEIDPSQVRLSYNCLFFAIEQIIIVRDLNKI